MTEQEFLNSLAELGAMHGAERMVLFGSRARGGNRPNSDFDVAVYGDADVRAISEAVDALPTLYSADIVDMNSLRNAVLVREIEEHGVRI